MPKSLCISVPDVKFSTSLRGPESCGTGMPTLTVNDGVSFFSHFGEAFLPVQKYRPALPVNARAALFVPLTRTSTQTRFLIPPDFAFASDAVACSKLRNGPALTL